ncbi:MAG TPA: glycosyltransferase [Candidatus Bathyarchaeia archaeon]|nr:glycosyltransferase [Candidatus Bathyarchaeia archaeon]
MAGTDNRRRLTLSIIIPVMEETSNLADMIAMSRSLAPLEIIVVCARHLIGTIQLTGAADCRVIPLEESAGLFVGRSLGAKHARGDVLLFLDEGRVLPLAGLQRLLFPIFHGNAQAVLPLEDRRSRKNRTRTGSVRCFSQLLNECCGRSDLQDSSLFDTPHAFTREALTEIGIDRLAHPAEAHRQLVCSQMNIIAQTIALMDEQQSFRPTLHAALRWELSCYERKVVEQQIRAIFQLPLRGGFSDGGRRRDIVEGLLHQTSEIPMTNQGKWPLHTSSLYGGQRLSVIIPACKEEATIGDVVREAMKLKPAEIIVVVNGSTDQTAAIAKKYGVTTVEYREPLGVDTGRAIGALLAKGDVLLFIDADFVIPARDMHPFPLACEKGIDVALNDLSGFLEPHHESNLVVAARQALNMAMNRKDLAIGSMVTVPFAMRREVVAAIGWPLLLCPPKAQIACALAGFQPQLAHEADIFSSNRFRPQKHLAGAGTTRSAAVEQILGDHIEAFQYFADQLCTKQGGEQVAYGQNIRSRQRGDYES